MSVFVVYSESGYKPLYMCIHDSIHHYVNACLKLNKCFQWKILCSSCSLKRISFCIRRPMSYLHPQLYSNRLVYY